MKNKRLNLFFCFALMMITVFSCIAQPGYTAYNKDDKKIPMDKNIYDEFHEICEKCSVNCANTGKITMNIGGADVSAKYTAYSKDMENKRIDVEYYGNKISIFVKPYAILRYFEKKNIIYSTRNKKNIAKFNHKKTIEDMRENGKITRQVIGDEIIYSVKDYANDLNGKFTVDKASGLLKHSIVQNGNGSDAVEVTYQNWEFKKPDFSLFREPPSATFKSTDDSNISKEPSGATFDLIER